MTTSMLLQLRQRHIRNCVERIYQLIYEHVTTFVDKMCVRTYVSKLIPHMCLNPTRYESYNPNNQSICIEHMGPMFGNSKKLQVEKVVEKTP